MHRQHKGGARMQSIATERLCVHEAHGTLQTLAATIWILRQDNL